MTDTCKRCRREFESEPVDNGFCPYCKLVRNMKRIAQLTGIPMTYDVVEFLRRLASSGVVPQSVIDRCLDVIADRVEAF